MKTMLSSGAFADLVADAAKRHGIPGLGAAFVHGDELRAAPSGILNIETQVPVTGESIFQIGSITKVFTGTLVMQLLDEGKIELDAPVRRYLPELEIAGEPVSDEVTIRRLLAHTSGIVGDLFIDTGRNDDATARYVERCRDLSYLTRPGTLFSYCNSGFNMLGRVIEVMTRTTWAARLRTSLTAPLGIGAAIDAEETPCFRAAVGHVLDDNGNVGLTPTCFLPRGTEAAGARLAMSPAALLAFARLHLRGGVAGSGERILSAASTQAMRRMEVRLPIDIAAADGYGLSWQIYDSWRPFGVGHDGATIGQSAFLRLIPAWDLAVTVLTNITSGGAAKAFDEILRAVLASIGETHLPGKPPADPSRTIDGARYTGTYETHVSRFVVIPLNGALHATVSQRNNESLGALPDHHVVLRPIDGDRFLAEDQPYGATSVVGFTEFNGEGKARFLFSGFRLAERVADAPN
jgi:CubicO group peptidase (beta-lactamase class C family)